MFLDFILIIFHIIILADVASAAGGYFETEEKPKWKEATTKCNMSIPDIYVGPDGYMAKFEHELGHNQVWIGYFRMQTAFDYVDCVKIDKQHNDRINLTQTDSSPGICYKACEYKDLIGVSNTTCICLQNDSNHFTSFKTSCTSLCTAKGEKGIVCGGEGYISVYRVTRNKTCVRGDNDHACLRFERYADGKNRLIWEGCSTYLLSLCKNGTGVTSIDQENKLWKDAVIKCFRNGLRPASCETLGQIKNVKTPSWTGVIRSKVIYTYKEWNDSYAMNKVQFGYLTKDKRIHFTTKDENKFVFCQETPTVTQTSTRSTSTENVLSAATSRQAQTDTQQPSTSTVNLSSAQTSGQGTDVGVVVGASLSVVVVATAVIIVVVCLIRRRKNPDLCIKLAKTAKPSKTERGQVEKLQDKIGSLSKKADGFHFKLEDNLSKNVSDSDHVSNYHVLEPHDRADTGYRKCGDENTTAEQTENVYHEIDGDDNTDYAQVFKDKNNMPNGDYYDTTTSAMKLKTKPAKSQEDYAELGNATYNHINYFPVNAGSTDNTYNIPNTLNVSQNGERTMGKADPGEKDTYSHINSTAVTNSKTDNVYGTPRD